MLVYVVNVVVGKFVPKVSIRTQAHVQHQSKETANLVNSILY